MKNKLDAITAALCVLFLGSIIALCVDFAKSIETIGLTQPLQYASLALILTILFGLYYTLFGCKKIGGSRYYVCYMGMYAVADLIALGGARDYFPDTVILTTLSVACCFVLCFAKDLGQKRSTSLAALSLVAKALILVIIGVRAEFIAMAAIISAVMALCALLMVCAKYFDKASRGSK